MERSGEVSGVKLAHAVEVTIDHAGKAALGGSRPQQPRSHHRGKRQGNNSRHDDGAGESECKLAEQRSGQATLNADGCIHRGEGDGHGDDRTHQLAGGVQGRAHWRFAHMDVPLDVFHHDDGVIHDQADREHDGKQSQQIDGEASHKHQENGADERDRDSDDRDKHGAHRAEEQENDHDDDE